VTRSEVVRRGVALETELERGLPCVAGDRVQLQQLLFNLLVNGMEAMEGVSDRPKRLFIRSKQEAGESVLVEVRDCGPGLRIQPRFDNKGKRGGCLLIRSHEWPGNIRELQNFIERALIVTTGRVLCPLAGGFATPIQDAGAAPVRTLADAERAHIAATLRETNWVIGGHNGAASRLGLPRTSLLSRMRRLGISRGSLGAPVSRMEAEARPMANGGFHREFSPRFAAAGGARLARAGASEYVDAARTRW
jgi:hypothetical protein